MLTLYQIGCVVPQNFPSHIHQDLSRSSSNGSRFLKGLHSQTSPKPVKIRVLVLSRNLRFSMVQSSLICTYTSSSIYISSLKTHNANLHSQELHLTHSQLQGQNGHFAVKSQNFWSTSYFELTIIIWSSLDHDSTSMAQKSSISYNSSSHSKSNKCSHKKLSISTL